MQLTIKSSEAPPPRVLVFSPTPTHPPVQGNRHRVLDLCRAIQSMGARITLLYYATEPIVVENAREMSAAWESLEIIHPHTLEHRRSMVRHPAIDDWYDDEISAAVSRLVTQRHFDVCLINYVWYSKLFEAIPASMIRVIDTHDVFGGRAQKFAEIGLDPAWFHTSIAQERIGLDRADFVIAIQDEEADLLRSRTHARVFSVGRLSPHNFLPVREKCPGEPLRVGYIGSGNPFNVTSILGFAAAALNRPDALDSIEFRVAGPVCDALHGVSHPFQLFGVVKSSADFYADIDVAINPMLGGTGLKIKSLEAMAVGKPLVGTIDAATGIMTDHPGHNLRSPADMLDYLMKLANQPRLLRSEAAVSREVYQRYHLKQQQQFIELWSAILATKKEPALAGIA